MIDFSAIEAELKKALSEVTGFKSIETGYIRENVPTASMPSLDISCNGYTGDWHDTSARYKVPCTIVLRRLGAVRQDNANEFKMLVEQCCTVLESVRGVAFDVIRNFDVSVQEFSSDTASIVRAGVIQIVVWAS